MPETKVIQLPLVPRDDNVKKHEDELSKYTDQGYKVVNTYTYTHNGTDINGMPTSMQYIRYILERSANAKKNAKVIKG